MYIKIGEFMKEIELESDFMETLKKISAHSGTPIEDFSFVQTEGEDEDRDEIDRLEALTASSEVISREKSDTENPFSRFFRTISAHTLKDGSICYEEAYSDTGGSVSAFIRVV